MICIECSNPDVQCLYSDFKSKYIQLTMCRTCNNVVDKYIEYDKVILFLDVLLLKPQAYRHAAYNIVEEEIFKDVKKTEDSSANKSTVPFSARYSKLRRYFVLSILFEVYLEWAYEEKSTWNTSLISQVLQAPPLWQYGFFILQQCIRKVTFCIVLVSLFTQVLQWGAVRNSNLPLEWNQSYHRCVLIVTILMSLAVKSLPIIMLIWPYENATIANTVVSILGMFNTIEALRVITHHSYGSICAVVLASNVVSLLTQQMVVCLFVGQLSSSHSSVSLFTEECRMSVMRIARVFELAF